MRAMALEIELKFRIPPDRLAAVRRAAATASARCEPLAAAYFDTPGEHLARARVALRLRREGDVWVQTVKAEGGEGRSAMQRLEDNVLLDDSVRPPGSAVDAPPALDIGRHAGSEAGDALRRALAEAGDAALGMRYATEVMRTRRVLRSGGARIELALDEGWLKADSRRLPVCEIEFELLQGPPQALLDLAARWVDRFGLVLDTRSKSERGHLLAAGRAASAPAKAGALRLPARAGTAQALAAMLADTLGQVLANASVLADAETADAVAAETEYLHQLRVGLRRLRSVLSVFGDPLPPAVLALAPALTTLFGQLGAQRDRDAMAESLWPALRSAGAPLVETPAVVPGEGAPALGELLRAPATQRLWLALLAASQPPAAAADAPPPAPVLAEALGRLHRQVRRDAARFVELDDARRHRLRRRIKRLRYATELSAALWPAQATSAYLRRLQRAQTPLGDYNDAVVALALYRTLAAQDPRAWFAVGWLSARRDALVEPCRRELARLARQPAPWRKA
jgi:inorganic triphosphatase YgiF